MGENLVGIYEDGVAAGGTLIRYAILVKTGCQILYLFDAGVEVVELRVFIQTNC